MLSIALPKGRLGDKVYKMMTSAGYECPDYADNDRKLIVESADGTMRYLLVKPSDVAVYVEHGVADVGIVGKDILMEDEPDVYELLDLGIGKCRMCVAAPVGYEDDQERTLRVATKYVNVAKKHFMEKNRDIEIIKLNGSIELCPILDLTDVIVDIVETGTTIKENNLDEDLLSQEQKASIYKTAETCKIALTDTPMCIMSVNINDRNYTLTLDNNLLIKIAHMVFEKIGEPIKRVLRDSHMNVHELKDIILVGGSCKMPTVAAYIEKLTGRSPCTDIDPDTAICVGAGIFAGIKTRNKDFKDIILTDICPFSLGIDVQDQRTNEQIMDFIIQRNSMLPTSKIHDYYAASDKQREINIAIYQGESIVPSNNIKLGELELNCPPTPINEYIASIRLTYDINGILVVDVTTNDKQTYSKVILSENNTMSEEEVERCKLQLEKLKIAPSSEEQYKLLIARAERIIEETLSFERDQIVHVLMNYKSCLAYGTEHDIRIMTKQFTQFLDQLEGLNTGIKDCDPDNT